MESGEWQSEEVEQRDRVLERIGECVRLGKAIGFDPSATGAFQGSAGGYSYVFDGEDDLLHLIVGRQDGENMSHDETGPTARFLLHGVPEAMIWLRPGNKAHHYYLGHDLLRGGAAPNAE